MSFEKFKRIVTGVANTTVKKAGEQVQITKLDLENKRNVTIDKIG